MKDWPQLDSLFHHDHAAAIARAPLQDPSVFGSDYPSSASMSRRRIGNLAVFLAVAAIASAMGYVRWQVPALLIPWIAGVWLAMHANALCAITHEVDEARDKAHELVERLDMFKARSTSAPTRRASGS